MNNVNVRIKYRTGKYTPIDENVEEVVSCSESQAIHDLVSKFLYFNPNYKIEIIESEIIKNKTRFSTRGIKMSKLNWNIVHECDDEDGNPTQWSSEINHPKYGKYCWINNMGDYFGVEVDYGGFTELVECKSLISAKRWVATQLMKR